MLPIARGECSLSSRFSRKFETKRVPVALDGDELDLIIRELDHDRVAGADEVRPVGELLVEVVGLGDKDSRGRGLKWALIQSVG